MSAQPEDVASFLTTEPDGVVRCAWATGPHEEALHYHDHEWGIASHDPRHIFEMITLGGFAAGIRWANVFRRRDGFRQAFEDYDLEKIAAFDSADVDRLMTDTSIIRNRRKIEATVDNARAALQMDRPLHELVWEYADPDRAAPRSPDDIHATSPEAIALAKRLQKAGFRWVGPNSIYAFMQTVGIVNDHIHGCFLASPEGV